LEDKSIFEKLGTISYEQARITSYPMRIQLFDKDTPVLVTGIAQRPTGANAFGFYPTLKIQEIKSGYLYFTQICHWHKQEVTFENEKIETFEINDLRDEDFSRCLDGHYRVYSIKDNQIFEPINDCKISPKWDNIGNPVEPEFEDAPYVHLENLWKRLWYGITFHTICNIPRATHLVETLNQS
jgi:hypothetical protein